MKTIELTGPNAPNVDDLVHAAQQEDVVLLRQGQPVIRMEKCDAEDLDDLQYESSPGAIEIGRLAREQYLRGEYKSLDQIKKTDGAK